MDEHGDREALSEVAALEEEARGDDIWKEAAEAEVTAPTEEQEGEEKEAGELNSGDDPSVLSLAAAVALEEEGEIAVMAANRE